MNCLTHFSLILHVDFPCSLQEVVAIKSKLHVICFLEQTLQN